MTQSTPPTTSPRTTPERTDREPKGYTRGAVAMIGKTYGYKAARRASKTHLRHWLDEVARRPEAGDADDAA